MDIPNTTKHYDNNKEKILSSTKNSRINDKKQLLSEKGFSDNLAPWARINSECITLCFSNVSELENMLLSTCSLTLNIDNSNNEIFRNTAIQMSASTKLKRRKEILKVRKFPTILAPWVRVNKETISLNFSTPEEFDKFLSISDLILKESKDIIRLYDVSKEPNSNI